MKLKNSYFVTYKENVKDEEAISGNLLVRGGFIKKNSAGVYMYLPLGFKVLKKIEAIVRDEMNAAASQEVLMPSLIPEDVYIASGRRHLFGSSMFAFKDRFDRSVVLGPTHEELFAVAASAHIKSYKNLPLSLYQFQTKFRDEPRPRFGVIRVREFIMKDAYTFDKDLDGLQKNYDAMVKAYIQSFDKMGLHYRIVKADTGVMGGLLSEEFQAITDIGEDTIVFCPSCDYSANLEIAKRQPSEFVSPAPAKQYSKLHTPNLKTIEQLCNAYNLEPKSLVKTLVYMIDEKLVAVSVCGHREVSSVKLQKYFNASSVELATPAQLVEANIQMGYIGPVDCPIPLLVDEEVLSLTSMMTGANEVDMHFVNVSLLDFSQHDIADVSMVHKHDGCPVCHAPLDIQKGIEVGNTFKLGDKYSKAMNLYYSDETNSLKPVIMGSYGIGLGRCMAAIVEQHHREKGIVWPIHVAPYEVGLLVVSTKDEYAMLKANEVYESLQANKVDVVLDDRDERVGVKFNDAELIGIPFQVVFGKALTHNQVELKNMYDQSTTLVDLNDLTNTLTQLIKQQKENIHG
jgi:prolyl-tRNA synthetase